MYSRPVTSDVARPKGLKFASQAERCTFRIAEEIRNGILRPGQRIGEESVAKKLGIGRAPVRVAFERLVSAGVLSRVHRGGTFVRKISLEEYCELSDVRAVLEGLAARLACERVTPADLIRLKKAAVDLDVRLHKVDGTDATSWMEIVRGESEFHAEIARLSGNRIIPRILAVQDLVGCCFQVGMALDLSYATSQNIVPHHRAVVRALASRDPGEAEKTLRDHVLLAKEQRILHLSGLGSRPATVSHSSARAAAVLPESKLN